MTRSSGAGSNAYGTRSQTAGRKGGRRPREKEVEVSKLKLGFGDIKKELK